MINDCSEDKKLSNMIFMITFCDGKSCNIFIILLGFYKYLGFAIHHPQLKN